MLISYDKAKRDRALAERDLDFAAAAVLFAGSTYTFEDIRADGETRNITVGLLAGRMIIVA